MLIMPTNFTILVHYRFGQKFRPSKVAQTVEKSPNPVPLF